MSPTNNKLLSTIAGQPRLTSPSRVLVVAAHPDDEILGCGGTIARRVAEGDEVSILILGEGITARSKRRDLRRNKKETNHLKQDIQKAARILGVARTFHYEFPDNRFDTVPLLDVIKVVEEVKSIVLPAVVYTHHGGDLNVDHRIAFQAVLTACRPQPNEVVKTIYCFEVQSSTEWRAPTADGVFLPTVYFDISATLPIKLKAMEVYESELRDYPHPRSLRAIDLVARRNGVEVGIEAAERFFLLRHLR
jgi:LmbE family N-acetylglucosaminyl deacetylase